jgi:hypothetical protein
MSDFENVILTLKDLKIHMKMRYFKRHWEETLDEIDEWGTSDWYFELNSEGTPLRQVQKYENGKTLKYDENHIEDEYGGLGDQELDLEEFKEFEISEDDFLIIWNNGDETRTA